MPRAWGVIRWTVPAGRLLPWLLLPLLLVGACSDDGPGDPCQGGICVSDTGVEDGPGADDGKVYWGVVDGNCDMNSQKDDVKEGKKTLSEG
jgi:hypothetical protein